MVQRTDRALKPETNIFLMKNYGIMLLLVWWAMPLMSGCAVVLLGAGAGAGVAGATYVMGKLEDEVNAPVSNVQRATVAALKALELPVDKERGDKLAAELESETADQKKIWISITSLTSSRSKIVIRVGVMGDERSYENVVGLRAVTSTDGMTADFFHFDKNFLSEVSNKIINSVKGVNRVVYDISSKPPATIEWE